MFIVCRVACVCPECCDKIDINDLNKCTCEDCQTKEATISLNQLSNRINVVNKKGMLVEQNSTPFRNNVILAKEKSNAQDLNPSQGKIIANVHPLLSNIHMNSLSQEISSLDSSYEATKTNGQSFSTTSNGTFISSMVAP